MFLAIPGTVLSIIYWLLPAILHGEGVTALQKAAVYLLLQVIMEGVGTFQNIARKGIMATITPFPYDRSRLITFANLFSGMLGEKVPGYILATAGWWMPRLSTASSAARSICRGCS